MTLLFLCVIPITSQRSQLDPICDRDPDYAVPILESCLRAIEEIENEENEENEGLPFYHWPHSHFDSDCVIHLEPKAYHWPDGYRTPSHHMHWESIRYAANRLLDDCFRHANHFTRGRQLAQGFNDWNGVGSGIVEISMQGRDLDLLEPHASAQEEL
jgi:hypothetical protein